MYVQGLLLICLFIVSVAVVLRTVFILERAEVGIVVKHDGTTVANLQNQRVKMPTNSSIQWPRNEIARGWWYPLRNVRVQGDTLVIHRLREQDRVEMLSPRVFRSYPRHNLSSIQRSLPERRPLESFIPWGGGAITDEGYPYFKRVRFSEDPFQLAKCDSFETSQVVFANVCPESNCYVTNLAHLIVNVLNPFFTWLFYVHAGVQSIRDNSLRLLDLKFPIPKTVLYMDTSVLKGQLPVLLYDVVKHLVTKVVDSKLTQGALFPASATHCFAAMDLPVPARGGVWDPMAYGLKGRWGHLDFYDQFWWHAKRLIGSVYLAHAVWSRAELDDNPRIVWAFRNSSNAMTSRVDGNMEGIEYAFRSIDPNFKFLLDSDFVWRTKEQDRVTSVVNLLQTIRSSNVLIGQYGANLWNSMFLREGSMLVELRHTYWYCSAEGRTTASHNHLSLYLGDIRRFITTDKVRYPDEFLHQLAQEVLESFHADRQSSSIESVDTGKCVFDWPAAGRQILTSPSQSHCYLEQTPWGWFQTQLKFGTAACENANGTVPTFYKHWSNCWAYPDVCAMA